jgi:two-component system cell cycle sensor histidine kinase/response regulator CckA
LSSNLDPKHMLQTLTDKLPVGIWVASAPGGEFVYANEMFAEIMGASPIPEAARGGFSAPYGIYTRAGALYPEDRLPFVRAVEARATVMVDDLVIHRPDGRKVYVRAQARPVFDANDVITHVIIAFIDISREVLAEESRDRSEAEMRHRERMQTVGRLAGGIAHDFNNLLAVITAVASKLRLRNQNEAEKRDLDSILEAAGKAAELTKSLLGFAGSRRESSSAMTLDELSRGVLTMIERGLDTRVALETDLGRTPLVVGDRSQLEQVVMNLCVNAYEAAQSRVRVTSGERDGSACVVIEDDGPGVDPDLRRRIFEPYFTTREHPSAHGRGLGLALAHGIVDAHGGRIAVDASPLLGGARMTMLLPRAHRPSVPPPMVGPRFDSDAGVVLVVDDQEMVRRALRTALEMLGYEVLVASDGVQAIEIFRDRYAQIRVVVLDVSMPNLDGRGALRELRQIDPSVRVLITTGYAPHEDVRTLMQLGATAVLEKPFNVSKLRTALAEVLADSN